MSVPLELVIFDCDGVLVDTERLAARIGVVIGAELGWPLTEREVVEKFMGKSEKSVRALVAARLGPGAEDRWYDRFHELFAAGLDDLAPVDGVTEALDAIAEAGLPTCVASSGSHGKMRTTLGRTGLWPRFEGRIFSATEVDHGKPAPDLFLYAARRMGVDPAACAVVEDSQYGVRAARAAGMRCFGYGASTGVARSASEEGWWRETGSTGVARSASEEGWWRETGGLSPAEWLAGPGTVVIDDLRKLPELLAAEGRPGAE